MASSNMLISTARLYRARAGDDDRYKGPLKVLDNATPSGTRPRRSGTTGQELVAVHRAEDERNDGGAKLLRHPMDFHQSVVRSGVEALDRQGLLKDPHTCLIAISPRASERRISLHV